VALQRGYSPSQFRDKILGSIGPFQVTGTIPSTAAGATGFVSITVPSTLGLLPGDQLTVIATGGGLIAGVDLAGQVVSSTTVAIIASNGTGGSYNPGSQVFTLVGFRFNQA
jgi:hypothetical protein